MMTLASDFIARCIGSWSLVTWTSTSPAGQTQYPFGEDAVGNLFYSEDGHMAAHLMRRQRPNLSSDDLMGGTPEERAAAYLDYFSYCGRYTVQQNAETVTHHVLTCSVPNWVGSDQVRTFRFSDDSLTLCGVIPGGSRHVLVWRHN
jgi:lipocalin-like protein